MVAEQGGRGGLNRIGCRQHQEGWDQEGLLQVDAGEGRVREPAGVAERDEI